MSGIFHQYCFEWIGGYFYQGQFSDDFLAYGNGIKKVSVAKFPYTLSTIMAESNLWIFSSFVFTSIVFSENQMPN